MRSDTIFSNTFPKVPSREIGRKSPGAFLGRGLIIAILSLSGKPEDRSAVERAFLKDFMMDSESKNCLSNRFEILSAPAADFMLALSRARLSSQSSIGRWCQGLVRDSRVMISKLSIVESAMLLSL